MSPKMQDGLRAAIERFTPILDVASSMPQGERISFFCGMFAGMAGCVAASIGAEPAKEILRAAAELVDEGVAMATRNEAGRG